MQYVTKMCIASPHCKFSLQVLTASPHLGVGYNDCLGLHGGSKGGWEGGSVRSGTGEADATSSLEFLTCGGKLVAFSSDFGNMQGFALQAVHCGPVMLCCQALTKTHSILSSSSCHDSLPT